MDSLVRKGMRAQLEIGSLITGQLLVALDLHPEAPPAEINWEGQYPEFPTVPTAMQELASDLNQVLKKIEKLPLEQIVNDLRDTIAGAKHLINSAELQESITALNETLIQAQKFVKDFNSNVSPQTARTLKELQAAARSIKVLAEYLERHPESLISGKGKSKRR